MKAHACTILFLCAATASAAPDKPKLDMIAFFTGKTHSESTLKVVLKRPVPLVVDSIGGKGDRGDFVLIETVHEGDKPVRERKWIMKQTGPNRFGGTLTDAVGPVDVEIEGDAATIRYTMKGGLKIEQQLKLLPGGKSLSNHVVAKKLGMKFARVEGTVRKLD